MKNFSGTQKKVEGQIFHEFNVPFILILLTLPILPHFFNDFYIVYLNNTFVTWEKVDGTWISTLTIGKWVMWILDFLIYFSFPIVILSIYLKKRWITCQQLDLKFTDVPRNILFGITLAAIIWFVLYLKWIYFGKWLNELFFGYRYYAFFYKPEDGLYSYILMSIYIGTAAGVLEEVLYRSFLIRGLERVGIPSWISVLLSILVFTGIHFCGGAMYMANGLIVGCIFGFIYLKIRNVIPLCIAHLLIDIVWVCGLDERLTRALNSLFL